MNNQDYELISDIMQELYSIHLNDMFEVKRFFNHLPRSEKRYILNILN